MPEFLAADEAQALVELVRALPLAEARYKDYTARRRVASFGGKFDYDTLTLEHAPPIPAAFMPWVERVSREFEVDVATFAHLLAAEYRPGTPLGWHRDVPDFESIVGLSLLGDATMRFRRYPHRPGERSAALRLALPPRSLYVIEGDARWRWQHSVSPTTELRYSITLRTLRGTPLLLREA